MLQLMTELPFSRLKHIKIFCYNHTIFAPFFVCSEDWIYFPPLFFFLFFLFIYCFSMHLFVEGVPQYTCGAVQKTCGIVLSFSHVWLRAGTQAVGLSTKHLSPPEPPHQPITSQFIFQWTSELLLYVSHYEHCRDKHESRHLLETLLSAVNSGVKRPVFLTR